MTVPSSAWTTLLSSVRTTERPTAVSPVGPPLGQGCPLLWPPRALGSLRHSICRTLDPLLWPPRALGSLWHSICKNRDPLLWPPRPPNPPAVSRRDTKLLCGTDRGSSANPSLTRNPTPLISLTSCSLDLWVRVVYTSEDCLNILVGAVDLNNAKSQ